MSETAAAVLENIRQFKILRKIINDILKDDGTDWTGTRTVRSQNNE